MHPPIIKTPSSMTLDDFILAGRQVVLDALDEFIRDKLNHEKARGWTDGELPELFKGVDAHLKTVAGRINKGEEPGSANFSVYENED